MSFDLNNPETYPRFGDFVWCLAADTPAPLVFRGFIDGQEMPLVAKPGALPYHAPLKDLSFYPMPGDEVLVRLGTLRRHGDRKVAEIREREGDRAAREKTQRLNDIYNADWIMGRFTVKRLASPGKLLVHSEASGDRPFPADALEVVSLRYPPSPENG